MRSTVSSTLLALALTSCSSTSGLRASAAPLAGGATTGGTLITLGATAPGTSAPGATAGVSGSAAPGAGPALALRAASSSGTAGPAAARNTPAADGDGPMRLDDLWGLPDWLDLRFEQRTRYESFDENFRANKSGEGHAWLIRNILTATARLDDNWRVKGEIMDGRQYGASEDLDLNTGLINAVNLLEANVGYNAKGVFTADDELDLQLGRQTLDLGSRRLIARNGYRNTINGFNGLLADWNGAEGSRLVAFAYMPVSRLPSNGNQEALRDNDIVFDEEQTDSLYYALFHSRPVWDDAATFEAYMFGLQENDEPDVATKNRDLTTLGLRLVDKADPGEFGYEWESTYQFGESRATKASADTTDLAHRAQFHHLEGAYRFEGSAKTRVAAMFDYASGDKDPNDDENNRYDTLYGVPRGDFGPTDLFGAFGRENTMSPGLRLTFDVSDRTGVMVMHRWHYLASDTDAWVRGGYRDETGDSGDYVGQLLELRLRHQLVPGNVRLEAGLAHFFPGSFVETAPAANGDPGDGGSESTYVWAGFRIQL